MGATVRRLQHLWQILMFVTLSVCLIVAVLPTTAAVAATASQRTVKLSQKVLHDAGCLAPTLGSMVLSPDGKTIFVLNGEATDAKKVGSTICAVDAATVQVRKLIDVGQYVSNPFFSPDGRTLYVSAVSEQGALAAIDTTALAVRHMDVQSSTRIALSRDGQRLFFLASSSPDDADATDLQLHILDAATGHDHLIGDVSGLEGYSVDSVVGVANDGKMLYALGHAVDAQAGRTKLRFIAVDTATGVVTLMSEVLLRSQFRFTGASAIYVTTADAPQRLQSFDFADGSLHAVGDLPFVPSTINVSRDRSTFLLAATQTNDNGDGDDNDNGGSAESYRAVILSDQGEAITLPQSVPTGSLSPDGSRMFGLSGSDVYIHHPTLNSVTVTGSDVALTPLELGDDLKFRVQQTDLTFSQDAHTVYVLLSTLGVGGNSGEIQTGDSNSAGYLVSVDISSLMSGTANGNTDARRTQSNASVPDQSHESWMVRHRALATVVVVAAVVAVAGAATFVVVTKGRKQAFKGHHKKE